MNKVEMAACLALFVTLCVFGGDEFEQRQVEAARTKEIIQDAKKEAHRRENTEALRMAKIEADLKKMVAFDRIVAK